MTFIHSMSQGQPGFDGEYWHAEATQLRRHLEAIFRGPCTCSRVWCWRCLASRIRIIPARSAYLAEIGAGPWLLRAPVNECSRHEATCPACIAEHGLYCLGEHEQVAARLPERA